MWGHLLHIEQDICCSWHQSTEAEVERQDHEMIWMVKDTAADAWRRTRPHAKRRPDQDHFAPDNTGVDHFASAG